MSFENTKSAISYLEKQRKVTAFDIFNLFHNLCDDAEAVNGSRLYAFPCKNVPEDDLAATLLWCSNTIYQVLQMNRSEISDDFYLEEFESELESLGEKMDELKAQNAKQQEKIAQQQQLLKSEAAEKEKLESQKEKLEAIVELLAKENAERMELEKACATLQKTIADTESIDLPTVRSKKESLEKDAEKLQRQKGFVEKEIEKIEVLIADLTEEKTSLESSRAERLGEQRIQTEERDNLKQKIRKAKDDVSALKKEIKQLQSDYDIEKLELSKLDGKQQELLKMIVEIREARGNLNLDVLTVRQVQEQAAYEAKKKEFDDKEAELDRLQAERLKEYDKMAADLKAKADAQLKDLDERKLEIQNEHTAAKGKIQIETKLLEAQEHANEKELQDLRAENEKRKADELGRIQREKEKIAREEQETIARISQEEKKITDVLEEKNKAIAARIQQKEEAIIACRKAKEEAIALEEKKKEELELSLYNKTVEIAKAMEATKAKIVEVKSKIAVMEAEKAQMNRDLDDAYKMQAALEAWFKSSVPKQTKESLASLQTQITLLKAAKRRLDLDFQRECLMDLDGLKLQQQENYRYFAESLSDMEKLFEKCLNRYSIVTDIYK